MPLIELKNITKTYTTGDSQHRVLNKVSLCVYEGEMIAILGPSGSGKSTLMNIIGLLDRTYNGEYWLNQDRTSLLHDNQLARFRNQHLGFVFQQFNLLPRLNSLQNIGLPLHYQNMSAQEIETRAQNSLKHVDMLGFEGHRPAELSGGQQQRIAIARALITEPDIILADEPTGSLDSRTSIEIMALFLKIHQEGRTLILITHDESIANQCTRKIILNDGEIITDIKS